MKLFSFCVFVVVLVSVNSQENPGVRGILRVYDECTKADSFSLCLKKKAVTFMDRLARMDKLSILDGVNVVKSGEIPQNIVLTEEQLENSLPRSLENKEEALDDMLFTKVTSYITSRTLQITLPQLDSQELGRAINEGNYIRRTLTKLILTYFYFV